MSKISPADLAAAAAWFQHEVIDDFVVGAEAGVRLGSTAEMRAQAQANLELLRRLSKVCQRIITKEAGR